MTSGERDNSSSQIPTTPLSGNVEGGGHLLTDPMRARVTVTGRAKVGD